MTETEEAPLQKRKASPSPPADDAVSKRLKLESARPGAIEDGEEPGKDPARNGSLAVAQPDAEAQSTNGSDLKQEQPDKQGVASASDIPSRTNASDAETQPRLSSDAKRPIANLPSARRNVSQEEKKRGQRLFGGLLSTLSQTPSSSPHWKKRTEIERRQQERAHQQRVEEDKRKAEKRSKLNHARKIDQVWFEEKAMHARHADMLAMARSLQTNSRPRLCYRPWQLTRSQEDIVEKQVREAKVTIEREAQQFGAEKDRRLRELGVSRPPPQPQSTIGEPKPPESTNRPLSASSASKMTLDRDNDDNGEVMQVGEEDTVLY